MEVDQTRSDGTSSGIQDSGCARLLDAIGDRNHVRISYEYVGATSTELVDDRPAAYDDAGIRQGRALRTR